MSCLTSFNYKISCGIQQRQFDHSKKFCNVLKNLQICRIQPYITIVSNSSCVLLLEIPVIKSIKYMIESLILIAVSTEVGNIAGQRYHHKVSSQTIPK